MNDFGLCKKGCPIVSVILPTYNRSTLIMRGVESVLNQTISDFELIIVDDGSSDNTFELLNNLILSDERVKYIKHKNKKLPLSLNTGLKLATGDYITFLGSDDEYLSKHMEIRLEYMKANPEVDLIYGGVKIIGNEYVKDVNNPKELIHLSECVIGGSFFGKREVFQSVEGFRDISYGEDYDLAERARIRYNVKKVDFEETYIYYRDTPDSICNNIQL
ncbi:MAG: glycosyltransferase [Ignavibacteriales bacterium]|nr:glycosyltransferase [Ignavibacteriales bacterium]HOJ18818.1 glycosyltransferase [Ignavibacteriaceae bacterium]HPO55669.1 glycosyltransferase [Ignavibacteriaceae bacterium]